MTRTAADVQAEIDALEDRARSACKTAVRTSVGLDDALRLVAETDDHIEPLKAERGRLARAELDAATSPAARVEAMRLRDTYIAAGGYGFGHLSSTWNVLPFGEAKAWAAVARESRRG